MKRKIGIISDVHGNLCALTAVLQLFKEENVEQIVHCGDVVNICGNSKECLQLLADTPNCILLLGNHDIDYLSGKASRLPLSHISAAHKRFVFESLGSEMKKHFADSKLTYTLKHGGTIFLFCHYALNHSPEENGYRFQTLESNPTAQKFDAMFAYADADVIFFGHKHEPCDINGKKTYIDVGSVGCHERPYARGIILELNDDASWNYRRVEAPYDRTATYRAMIESKLPDAQYIFEFYCDRIHKD